MPVAINLSNRNIKLVASQDGRIEKWATKTLPDGLIKDGRILQPQAVAEAINSLFNSLQLPRRQVIASLTGLSFTYRILQLPHLKPAKLAEAVERATRREIPVSLDELYLDWKIISEKEQGIEVFVLGVPRSLIDELSQTMELAKIKLTAVDIKALALSRAVGQANALIVDFEPDCFDITIISGGVPVTLYPVIPRSRDANPEDKVSQLIDELGRTLNFYNLTHKDNPITAGTPVLLAGELADKPSISEIISRSMGRPVQAVAPRLKVPVDFPIASQAGNLGLILKNNQRNSLPKGDSEGYHEINVDLLAVRRRIKSHRVSLRRLLPPVAIVLIIVLVIPVSLLRHKTAAETNTLQTELNRVSSNLLQKRQTLAEAKDTETAIAELTSQTEALQLEREQISGKGKLSADINFIINKLPSEVDIKALTSNAREIVLDGQAASRADIFEYAHGLEEDGKFSEVRIALIEDIDSPEGVRQEKSITFRIVIER